MRGQSNKSCNLISSFSSPELFLSLLKGKVITLSWVAEYLLSFFAIFHNFVLPVGHTFKEFFFFRNEFVVANVSLINWFTRGLKTVCN